MIKQSSKFLIGFLLVVFGLGASGCTKSKNTRPEPTAEDWLNASGEPSHESEVKRELQFDWTHSVQSGLRLVEPSDGTTLGADELVRNQGVVVLTWAAIGQGAEYFVQISRDRNFRYLVANLKVPQNVYLAREALRAGDYYWRVGLERNDNGQEARLVSSNVFHFRIDTAAEEHFRDAYSDKFQINLPPIRNRVRAN